MTQMATGALAFLRGDVRPARETVVRSYAREQVFESRRLARTEQPYFTPGFPLALPLTHGVRIASLDGAPTATHAPLDTTTMVSDTRELTWRTTPDHHGLVTEETDRTQALIGFVGTHRPAVRNLAADVGNEFAAIVLSAVDARPIASAARLLLTTGSRVSNTGLQWNAERTRTTQQGGPPSLIEPVTGTVTLRRLAGRVRAVSARALDGAGKPVGAPIAARRTAAGWVLPIGVPVTTWYLVSVDRR
jgi:hypothetical protein